MSEHTFEHDIHPYYLVKNYYLVGVGREHNEKAVAHHGCRIVSMAGGRRDASST